jgi:hypothetical protein
MLVIQDIVFAPPVRFEPCQVYVLDPSAGACAECGWLEEDH